MPNKYEREIEEILRNMENPESRTSLGQKQRRKPESRMNYRQRRAPSFNLKGQDWLLIIAVASALIAGGLAYSLGSSLVTGIIALIGAVCVVLLVLSPFVDSPRSSQSSRYGNVSRIHRNPLNNLTTRWNLFLLKLRYRRKRGS